MTKEISDQTEHKVAIVTGANRGIGLATVEKFINEGWWVYACARSESEELNALLEENGQVCFLDLADEESVTNCARDIIRNTARVDALVNCGGVAHGAIFSMTKLTDLQNVFQVNFFSQILFSQYISKKMMRKKKGAIINLTSTAGILADSGTLAYGCSKAALSHATRIMATELGAFNIRVNAIAPARVETDMGRLMDDESTDLLNSRSSITGDICAEDVADLVYYLCSEGARYLSGQVIRLDRGMPF
ncbi:MAG: SDR family oxidoreductase [Sedimenticola sp.]|nr:SDR family oxidoreductase [Sedimenticola sp.]